MSYIAANLAPGESVRATVRVHWGIFLPAIWSIIVFVAVLWATSTAWLIAAFAKIELPVPTVIIALAVGVVTVVTVAHATLYWLTTEMAVTNKKIIAKWGLIGRRTMEQRLSKVESITVEQDLFGRMFNYGSIYVHGTGSSSTPIRFVANPAAFRREIEQAIEALETA